MNLLKKQLDLGIIQFSGPDSEKFLQGQITSDASELSLELAQNGAYCSPNGRIRANFILSQRDEESYLMLLPIEQVTFLIEVLKPYIAFFKSEMTDVTNDYGVVGIIEDLQTDKSENHQNDWKNIFQLKQPEVQWQRTYENTSSCIRISANAQWIYICGNNDQDSSRFLSEIPQDLESNWNQQRIRNGLVWIDEESRDQFLPHDISLPALGAVSFTKGCYSGQEIVARMHYRGDPKYQLAILDVECPDISGNELNILDQLNMINDQGEKLKIGKLVSKLQLSNNNYCLAVSIKKLILQEQSIKLVIGDQSYPCKISTPHDIQVNTAQGAEE